jgi:hypothetical protein
MLLFPGRTLWSLSTDGQHWRWLRGLRATPPGFASRDPNRREVFASALEQAEQFLRAASDAGYTTKPVQLFYALSQAGRAICAVRSPEVWEIHGHGARVENTDPISQTSVTVNASGALPLVAHAIGSEFAS